MISQYGTGVNCDNYLYRQAEIRPRCWPQGIAPILDMLMDVVHVDLFSCLHHVARDIVHRKAGPPCPTEYKNWGLRFCCFRFFLYGCLYAVNSLWCCRCFNACI